MKPRTITVNDRMQTGYSYQLTEPEGKNFHPEFRPDLTPAQMLEMGIFGGKYMTDCREEFPAAWFERAKLSPQRRDPKLNFFGVDASKPLWRRKAGSGRTTRVAGSSGTAATTWAVAARTTRARSAAGRP